MTERITVPHGRIRLALHRLADRPGRPLLLLHELGGRSPEAEPLELSAWPGPVWALDFTGHGASSRPAGGGYTAEILVADADVALGHCGAATVVGSGLGAYVALLLAGSRPSLVRGAILRPGRGLAGGGPEPAGLGLPPWLGPSSRSDGIASSAAPDPAALACFEHDIRPPGYARLFVRQARHLSGLPTPITLSDELSAEEPPWLAEVARADGVATAAFEVALSDALAHGLS